MCERQWRSDVDILGNHSTAKYRWTSKWKCLRTGLIFSSQRDLCCYSCMYTPISKYKTLFDTASYTLIPREYISLNHASTSFVCHIWIILSKIWIHSTYWNTRGNALQRNDRLTGPVDEMLMEQKAIHIISAHLYQPLQCKQIHVFHFESLASFQKPRAELQNTYFWLLQGVGNLINLATSRQPLQIPE